MSSDKTNLIQSQELLKTLEILDSTIAKLAILCHKNGDSRKRHELVKQVEKDFINLMSVNRAHYKANRADLMYPELTKPI